jgi:hypothetical protein
MPEMGNVSECKNMRKGQRMAERKVEKGSYNSTEKG